MHKAKKNKAGAIKLFNDFDPEGAPKSKKFYIFLCLCP
jgi:hypothetical protein